MSEKPAAARNRGDLTRDPVPGLIRRVAVPVSVGFFFHTMINVVDTFFAGRLSTDALAALSLSFPLFFIITSLATGLSTGATALIGTALGEEDEGEAAMFAAQGVVFGGLVGLALMFVGPAASPFLFRALGAQGNYLAICLEYMDTIFLGAPLFIWVNMLNAALQAQGDTRALRNFLVLACLLNAALDPWFIFGGLGLPAMGVRGIALATLAVEVMGCVYLWRRLAATGLTRGHWRGNLMPRRRAFADISRQGFPSVLNFMTIGLGIFVIIYFVAKYGQEPVAAYGIATRVEQIVLLPTIGLNVAALAIVAQNMGGRRFERVHEALGLCLRYGFWIMAGGTVVVFTIAEPAMRLFADDPAVVEAGVSYLRIAAFALYGYVILFVHVAALQGAKRPFFAIWIGLFRQVAAPVAVFWLATEVFDVGLAGIWWGIFGIVWFSAGGTMLIARRILAHEIRRRGGES
ncbi:MATE family efflux transporter [Desulfohalovibrio reitneri]|uniref:MATE family efflux transporter n=1 Tax=Desulfohalovibrio reitneri TaxID=1307759 RepID=UPI0004A6AD5E|nr:MATE family efflux transporter [Desulfohalovibrio reitneri]